MVSGEGGGGATKREVGSLCVVSNGEDIRSMGTNHYNLKNTLKIVTFIKLSFSNNSSI